MVNIKEISLSEFIELEKNIPFLPLWSTSLAAKGYKHKSILIIEDEKIIKGVFVLPLMFDGKRYTAEREYRVFPYASPILFEKDNMKRRKYVFELFKYIKQKYELIELPLYYEFKDVAPIQSLGMFVEYWHTHTTRKKLGYNDLSRKLRYNIKYAEKYVDIKIDNNVDNFDFSKAIHGTKEEIELRSQSAKNVINSGNGIIFSAFDKKTNEKVASTIIVFDSKVAYYLHCYRDNESARGTIPLLLFKAIEYSFDVLKVEIFDFEGAVIQGIDEFFSTFNVDITPYGYLYFASNKEEYMELIESTLYIEGRLCNEEM